MNVEKMLQIQKNERMEISIMRNSMYTQRASRNADYCTADGFCPTMYEFNEQGENHQDTGLTICGMRMVIVRRFHRWDMEGVII